MSESLDFAYIHRNLLAVLYPRLFIADPSFGSHYSREYFCLEGIDAVEFEAMLRPFLSDLKFHTALQQIRRHKEEPPSANAWRSEPDLPSSVFDRFRSEPFHYDTQFFIMELLPSDIDRYGFDCLARLIQLYPKPSLLTLLQQMERCEDQYEALRNDNLDRLFDVYVWLFRHGHTGTRRILEIDWSRRFIKVQDINPVTHQVQICQLPRPTEGLQKSILDSPAWKLFDAQRITFLMRMQSWVHDAIFDRNVLCYILEFI